MTSFPRTPARAAPPQRPLDRLLHLARPGGPRPRGGGTQSRSAPGGRRAAGAPARAPPPRRRRRPARRPRGRSRASRRPGSSSVPQPSTSTPAVSSASRVAGRSRIDFAPGADHDQRRAAQLRRSAETSRGSPRCTPPMPAGGEDRDPARGARATASPPPWWRRRAARHRHREVAGGELEHPLRRSRRAPAPPSERPTTRHAREHRHRRRARPPRAHLRLQRPPHLQVARARQPVRQHRRLQRHHRAPASAPGGLPAPSPPSISRIRLLRRRSGLPAARATHAACDDKLAAHRAAAPPPNPQPGRPHGPGPIPPHGDMPPDELREHGHRVIDWIAEYFEHIDDYPVLARVEPGEVAGAAPARGAGGPPRRWTRSSRDFREVIVSRASPTGTTPASSPTSASPAPARAILGETLAAALNVNAMLWRTSPAATELEERALDWLRQMLGLPAGFRGHIQDTASMLDAGGHRGGARGARAWACARRGSRGRDLPRLRLYCSEEAHSSRGEGGDHPGHRPRRHAPDPHRRGVPHGRRPRCGAAIEEDRAAGVRPFCVVATVGHHLHHQHRPGGGDRGGLPRARALAARGRARTAAPPRSSPRCATCSTAASTPTRWW